MLVGEPIIDADYLPLTEEELHRALLLVLSPEDARHLASQIATLAAETDAQTAGAAEARAGGSNVPDEINPPSWFVGEELFAMIWCVPEFSARIDDVMERGVIRGSESRLRGLMAMRGLMPDAEPPSDLVQIVRQEVGRSRAVWTRRKRAMADRIGVPRPDGTRRKE